MDAVWNMVMQVGTSPYLWKSIGATLLLGAIVLNAWGNPGQFKKKK